MIRIMISEIKIKKKNEVIKIKNFKDKIKKTLFLVNLLFKVLRSPKFDKSVEMYEIKKLFKRLGVKNYEITDDYYKTMNVLHFNEFLALNLFRHRKWTKRHDCDNFSIELCGLVKLLIPRLAFGMIHIDRMREKDRHALNFLVYWDNDKKLKIVYVEPQNNNIISEGVAKLKKWRPYFAYI